MNPLPIDEVLPRLLEALRARNVAVLQAPPGAGKTTRVPLALYNEPWLQGKRVVMLEPRRLAARAAAHRMAATLGERAGMTVGYRMRMETVVSPATRIEVLTEGILARMLQHDAALEGVGVVIFDEFHERSLQADLGLALALQSQSLLRDDLRILVMSATLDGDAVAGMLGDAPVITSVGRSFAVDVRYLPRHIDERIEAATVKAVRRALTDDNGDVLVFLPGAGEIRRVESTLGSLGLDANVDIAPLYGNLPQDKQDLAIAPSRAGRRKVVLSTSIAETSLTIDGVSVVIDSGVMRVPRFSPRSGMTRLETVRVTQSSAEQRRGRAGRLGPGVCYRLWSELEHNHLLPFGQPEILEADLAPLALELAAWGVADPRELRWLDEPPHAAYAQARELLRELGAIGSDGSITAHGKLMAEMPLHPRLAHMVMRGVELNVGSLACDIAALLSERDVFRSSQHGNDVDLRLRLEALRSEVDSHAGSMIVDSVALRRVREVARMIRERVVVRQRRDDIEMTGVLLALAYPDRIGALRAGQRGRFLLRNGRAAVVSASQPLAASDFIVAADLDGAQRESRVYLAAPVERASIEEHFADQFEQRSEVTWDEDGLRARSITQFGALIMRDVLIASPDSDIVADALLDWIRSEGSDALPWSKSTRTLQQRMMFVHHRDVDWPDVSDAKLIATLEKWLRPRLQGIRRRADIARLDLNALLLDHLTWEQRRKLDEFAPTHISVPSGSHIPVDYSIPDAPTLSVRLQEMFGAKETPRVLGGRVPLTLHLLSPAGRPAQVTRDLASFWQSGYFVVRKDLRGRYPKHYWPDDPLQAEPTRRTKRSSQ